MIVIANAFKRSSRNTQSLQCGDFEHFWDAQLVWDETMAERVTEYLSTHPEKAMVVLAGAGHMEFGSGIPNRVRRRLPQRRMAVLITNDKPQTKSHLTDYSLLEKGSFASCPESESSSNA